MNKEQNLPKGSQYAGLTCYLPCPWCGSQPYEFQNGDLWCGNDECPTRKRTKMTPEDWNNQNFRRKSPWKDMKGNDIFLKLQIDTEKEALLLYEAVKRKFRLLKDSLEMQNFVSDKDNEQLLEYEKLLNKVDKFYGLFIKKAGDYDPVKFSN